MSSARQRLERRTHAWTTLFAAYWAITIWDPQTLWDLGFQLSALATASLFAFGKGTEALLLKTPLRVSWLDRAREALIATLAAQILALPLWVLLGYYAIVVGGCGMRRGLRSRKTNGAHSV